MKGLNLSGFKKVSSTKDHTVMRDPKGHELKIAHSALSPKMRAAIQALPSNAVPQEQQAAAKATTFQSNPVQAPARQPQGGPQSQSAEDTPTDAMADGGQVTDIDLHQDKYAGPAKEIDYQKLPEGVTDIDYQQLPAGTVGRAPASQPAPKKMAEGGPTAPTADDWAAYTGADQANANPPAQQQAAPAQDPTLEAKRAMYNKYIAGNFGPDQPPNMGPAQFGPGGEAPQQFNPEVWNKVEKDTQYNAQQDQLKSQQQAEQAKIDNLARQKAGLPPLPVPPSSQSSLDAQNGPSPASMPAGSPSPTQQTQQSDPWGTQTYYDTMQKANDEMHAGQMGAARASAIEGQQQAADIENNLQIQQQQANTFQQHYNDLDRERQAFQADLMNQHIDPQHYLNSMGTMGKIKSAIGLILGGIGGGLTRQGNPALAFLEHQINNDIEAQKGNIGIKENLLSANMKQFNNMRDATDMTRVMQMDIVSNMLKESAAKAQGPLAQARAQMALGEWDQKMAPIMSQIAMRKALLGAGAAGQVKPESIIQMMVPEGERNEAFKQLKEAQDTSSFRDNALSAFDQLSKLQTMSSRVGSPLQSASQIKAIMDPVIASLSKGTAGRFTEQDAGMLQTLMPTLTDNPQTIAVKRSRLMKLAEEKLHYPMLNVWGIDPRSFGQYQGGTGQKRIQMSAPVRQ